MPIINTNVASTTTITQNGTYDVAPYTSAIVNTPQGAPSFGLEGACFLGSVDANGNYVLPTGRTENLVFTGLTQITAYSQMNSLFYGSSMDTATFPDLVSVEGKSGSNNEMNCDWFFARSKVRSVSFPALTTVTGTNGISRWFYDCNNLEEVSVPELQTITSASMCFYRCVKLTTLSFPKLTTVVNGVSNLVSYGSTAITVYFQKLDTIPASNGFGYFCQNRKCIVYFNSLKASTFSGKTSALSQMFQYSSSGCVMHLPTNLDPSNPDKTFDFSTLTGYPSFGGNNVSLLFDLPATE